MKQVIWKFGLLSGVVASGLMLLTMPFMDKLGHGSAGWVVGYTGIVLSFLLVYFGIRSYRDHQSGGAISFGRAFGVGISIVLISCAFYVVTWEISYFTFLHGIMDHYGDSVLARMQAAGASAAAIQAKTAELVQARQMYENPLYNSALTFLEPFPVGLIMTLLSAMLLRKGRKADLVSAA